MTHVCAPLPASRAPLNLRRRPSRQGHSASSLQGGVCKSGCEAKFGPVVLAGWTHSEALFGQLDASEQIRKRCVL